jgi:ADP-ribosyl-[dinitrogen reductase] hydrolase
MRLAPVPLFYRHDPVAAVERAGDSSRTTHGAEECIDACRYFASLLIGALDGASKEELLSPAFESAAGIWQERPLAPKIDDISRGSFVHREPPEIRGTGYVVDCLEAALWAFHRTGSFRDAVLAAANLGDDADTTAAVCGQIAGAFYGEDAIPAEWLERLARRDLILQYADRLKAG